MTGLFKFKEFSYCPKCNTLLRDFPLYTRINTRVIYQYQTDHLFCRCETCGFTWYELSKDDPKNEEVQ